MQGQSCKGQVSCEGRHAFGRVLPGVKMGPGVDFGPRLGLDICTGPLTNWSWAIIPGLKKVTVLKRLKKRRKRENGRGGGELLRRKNRLSHGE